MGNDVRIGYVSSVDYVAGMVCVTYPDKNNSTTARMPFFSFSGEYKMPEIQDKVLVVHLSNDSSSGVVLGRFWGEERIPPVSGSGLYRKEFDQTAYEQSQNGSLVIHAVDLRFECSAGSITIAELIEMKRRLDAGLGVKPRGMLEKIEQMVEKGEVNSLIIGREQVGGHGWVITKSSETWSTVLSGGELLCAGATLTLQEYV